MADTFETHQERETMRIYGRTTPGTRHFPDMGRYELLHDDDGTFFINLYTPTWEFDAMRRPEYQVGVCRDTIMQGIPESMLDPANALVRELNDANMMLQLWREVYGC